MVAPLKSLQTGRHRPPLFFRLSPYMLSFDLSCPIKPTTNHTCKLKKIQTRPCDKVNPYLVSLHRLGTKFESACVDKVNLYPIYVRRLVTSFDESLTSVLTNVWSTLGGQSLTKVSSKVLLEFGGHSLTRFFTKVWHKLDQSLGAKRLNRALA